MRRITAEISVQEMLGMREQGLSNHEIARLLDISPMTVYRYIGKPDATVRKRRTPRNPAQPCAIRPPSDTPAKEEKQVIKQEEPAEWTGGLKLVSSVVHAESANARYAIDRQAKTVKVHPKGAGEMITLTKEQLEAYAEELLKVLQYLEG